MPKPPKSGSPLQGIHIMANKYTPLRRIGHQWFGPSPFVDKDDKNLLVVCEHAGLFTCFATGRSGDETAFVEAILECGILPRPDAPFPWEDGLRLVVKNAAPPAAVASIDDRRVSVNRTRQLIENERFEILLRLLVEAGKVDPDAAGFTCEELALRFRAYARGELTAGFVVHPGELEAAADDAQSLAMEWHSSKDAG